jgi:hypothetical protein
MKWDFVVYDENLRRREYAKNRSCRFLFCHTEGLKINSRPASAVYGAMGYWRLHASF